MRKLLLSLIGVFFVTFPAAALADGAPSGTYILEKKHAYLQFSYNHMGASHPIVLFRKFDATLHYKADDPEKSKVKVTIDPNSIDTGMDMFDKELAEKPDFLDAGNYPEITFVATNLEQTGDGKGRMTGDLTIKGVTKPVTLDVTLNKSGTHPMSGQAQLGFSATGTFKRSDFGIGYAVPMVSDELTVTIEVEFMPSA
ncbi:YceI family protein [Emcibacter nanhaiensis]|uniref:Polyisoprenoid-binding protein n=1 Tax=Emcibacter nanhaiensis TaxID=1505037 RepID=A0A501PFD4_9PROT|nr:YceI family protein [Emcibacter nanhaiensis]TPD59140.1 polyisoprenoid-binding protein [Emcibacter nanhaiensis]